MLYQNEGLFAELITDWEKIHTTHNEIEAHLIRGCLEGEGIPCRLQSMRIPQFPLTVSGLGAIDIYVPVEEAARSKRLLFMIYHSVHNE
ncbi:MAG: hypothetical protein D6736_03820 [Nitrospinota bacterium]|nr:MAG: hypothetical protein D6736_03820 [Nitrospinota bacterium]